MTFLKFKIMQKTMFFFIAATLVLVSTGCIKNPDCDVQVGQGEVNLRLKGKWGSEPYVLNTKRAFRPNDSIKLSEVMFYMSDIRLTNSATKADLSPIALVTFSKNHQTLAGAQKGESVATAKVAEGTYTTLAFGLGVSPSLNATTPNQYSSSHPLGDPGLYWGTQRYVFTRIAGNLSKPTGGALQQWGYHTGTNPMYRTVTVAIPNAVVKADASTEVVLNLDLKKLFINGTDTLALGGQSLYQDPDSSTERPLLDNWTQRLSAAFL
jgi:hypothetical protein